SYVYVAAGDVGGGSAVELMIFMDVPNWDVKLGDWCCSCSIHNYTSSSNCFTRHLIRVEDDAASMAV
ncbi:unnamed protein product, partial [Musa acuminata var. zebrina]